jgi:hypothetical protein
MIRSGLPFLHEIFLEQAAAASFVVALTLLDEDGDTVHQWNQTVPVGAVSFLIEVPAQHNTLGTGIFLTSRDLLWSAPSLVGEIRYAVEARPPFGVSAQGVRSKLGVSPSELPDSEISLIKGFIQFQGELPLVDLTTLSDQAARLAVKDAIEALSALAVIHTMTVRVAASEDSGTNAFRRQNTDWQNVAEHLDGIVLRGYLAANPGYIPGGEGSALFLVVTPDEDPVTGEAYAT